MSLRFEHDRRPLHIVVTGSSQGIGLVAARRLIQEGHIIYHACRNEERAREAVAAAGGGYPLVCDLSDLNSVKKFSRTVKEQVPRLDVLCLNAGIAPSATSSTQSPRRLTSQGFEPCIGINHIGHFLLVQLLYRKLAADGGGRLVVTASSVHDPALKAGQSGGKTATLGDMSGLGINLRENPSGATMVDGAVEYHGGKVYKDSKLCNILMTRHAAKVLPSSIRSVSFNPGFVPTTSLFDSLRRESYWKAQALTLMASLLGFSVPVEVAGQRLAYLATTPLPNTVPNGAYYSAPVKSRAVTPAEHNAFDVTTVSKEAATDSVAEQLWEDSMKVVGEWL